MLELLLFIAVIIIVVVAIKLGKQDDSPAARPSGLPDGLKMARQRAIESGDTEAVQAIDNGTRPLGTPLGLVHWKRASSPVEAGTAGYL